MKNTLLLLLSALTVGASPEFLIVAHRGASGYLPEHTLEAAAFAYAQGADFIEQDVVMSKDDVLVVCHDIHIDTVTNVAVRFPERKRADGRFYAVDFTWAELRGLQVNERVAVENGQRVFPRRFDSAANPEAGFRLCSVAEQFALIRGLNGSTGRRVGVCPEIKDSAWHHKQGKDPGKALIALLAEFGYSGPDDLAVVQCFDPRELKRLRAETGTRLRFLQLLWDTTPEEPEIDYAAMMTQDGLREIATYAQWVGPHLGQLVHGANAEGRPLLTPLAERARVAGLILCPYTFRSDALPKGVPSIEVLLEVFVATVKVQGLFIDQPDAAVRYREKH